MAGDDVTCGLWGAEARLADCGGQIGGGEVFNKSELGEIPQLMKRQCGIAENLSKTFFFIPSVGFGCRVFTPVGKEICYFIVRLSDLFLEKLDVLCPLHLMSFFSKLHNYTYF